MINNTIQPTKFNLQEYINPMPLQLVKLKLLNIEGIGNIKNSSIKNSKKTINKLSINLFILNILSIYFYFTTLPLKPQTARLNKNPGIKPGFFSFVSSLKKCIS